MVKISPEAGLRAWQGNPSVGFSEVKTFRFKFDPNDKVWWIKGTPLVVVDPTDIAGSTGWASMNATIAILSIKGPV